MCTSDALLSLDTTYLLYFVSNSSGVLRFCLPAGECAQIAERLKKAMGKAAEGKPLQGQAAAVLAHPAASLNAPGYEGDVEMQ